MSYTRFVSRILMGIFIAIWGLYLLFMVNSTAMLPEIFSDLNEYIPIFLHFLPYETYYFKLNSLLFVLSGIFIIIGSWYSILFQIIGSLMYCLTYDNPFIAKKMTIFYQKIFYLHCNLIVIFTIIEIIKDIKSSKALNIKTGHEILKVKSE